MLYFQWMCNQVCTRGQALAYRSLLEALDSTEFTPSLEMDANRAADGVDLRRRYEYESDGPVENLYYRGEASVLEMMVALAIRIEGFMDDFEEDRTHVWFWDMIQSLGLEDMRGSHFNQLRFDYILNKFLSNDYEPNGVGGLFILAEPPKDLRTVEIWYQAMWYLNEVT